MQRRAAAAYVAMFIVISAGAFAFMAGADEPEITFSDPAVSASAGDTFTVGGTEYTVEDVGEPESEGGGLEEGEEASGPEANISWSAEVRQSASWSAGDVVEYDGGNWTVEIPDGDDPSSFELVEHHEIDRETVERNGSTYVVVERDGEEVLVERGEYIREEFGEPERREYAEGESFNDTWSVDEVTAEEVTFGWNETEEQTTTFAQGENVTLGDTTYVALFPDDSRFELSTDHSEYREAIEDQERYQERINGFWGIVIVGVVTAILLLGLAFLPVRR